MVAKLSDLIIEAAEKRRAPARTPACTLEGTPRSDRRDEHEDGQPMEISELPANSTMFIGWCESNEFGELLSGLQDGNPRSARTLWNLRGRTPRGLPPEARAEKRTHPRRMVLRRCAGDRRA